MLFVSKAILVVLWKAVQPFFPHFSSSSISSSNFWKSEITASPFLHCLMHLISFIFQPSLETLAALFGAICSLLRCYSSRRQPARWVHILGKAEIKRPGTGALQERLINRDQRHLSISLTVSLKESGCCFSFTTVGFTIWGLDLVLRFQQHSCSCVTRRKEDVCVSGHQAFF